MRRMIPMPGLSFPSLVAALLALCGASCSDAGSPPTGNAATADAALHDVSLDSTGPKDAGEGGPTEDGISLDASNPIDALGQETASTSDGPDTEESGCGSVCAEIFSADFETGDLSYFDGSRGEVFGKGTNYKAYVTTTPALGKYSCALQIGTGDSSAMYLFSYIVPQSPLGRFSVDYWIPKGVQPDPNNYWWNIWQWKSVDTTYNKPLFDLNLLEIEGVLQLVLNYVPGGTDKNPTQTLRQTEPVPFPTEQWVHVAGLLRSVNDDTGYVEIYQEGLKVLEWKGVLTKPGDKDVLWSINTYSDTLQPDPATIYVDNMKIQQQ